MANYTALQQYITNGNGVSIIQSLSGETIYGGTLPVPCFIGDGSTLIEYINPNQTGGSNHQYTNSGEGVTTQIIISEATDISDITLTCKKAGGSGFLRVEIRDDNAGTPGSTVLGSAIISAGTISTGSFGVITIPLSSQIHLPVGTYWATAIVDSGFINNFEVGTSNIPGSGLTYETSDNGSTWIFYDNRESSFGFSLVTIPGRFYISDAGFSGRDSFDIFVTTTQVYNVITNGTISGDIGNFSSLSFPSLYYVSDTRGIISTTPGSTSLKVGKSFSATNLIGYPRI